MTKDVVKGVSRETMWKEIKRRIKERHRHKERVEKSNRIISRDIGLANLEKRWKELYIKKYKAKVKNGQGLHSGSN